MEIHTTSVIILNWNGTAMLRRYLPSVISSLAGDPSARLIVADNGSTDESVAVLAKEFPSVEVLRLDRNYGFAEGYNRAIATVDTDYVVLLNSDVRTPAGWLQPLVAYMENHPRCAAVQPKIRSDRRPEYFEHAGAAGGFVNFLGYPYCRGRVMSRVEPDHGQYDTDICCDWASGACMCTRTAVYKELGGLDERFFAHMEEIDLCWRMRRAGYSVACCVASTVYHYGGGALPYSSPRKLYLNFRNNHWMLRRNLPLGYKILLYPVRLVLDWAAAARELVCGRPEGFRAILKARLDGVYH